MQCACCGKESQRQWGWWWVTSGWWLPRRGSVFRVEQAGAGQMRTQVDAGHKRGGARDGASSTADPYGAEACAELRYTHLAWSCVTRSASVHHERASTIRKCIVSATNESRARRR